MSFHFQSDFEIFDISYNFTGMGGIRYLLMFCKPTKSYYIKLNKGIREIKLITLVLNKYNRSDTCFQVVKGIQKAFLQSQKSSKREYLKHLAFQVNFNITFFFFKSVVKSLYAPLYLNRSYCKEPYEPLSNAPSERSYGIQCLLNLNIQVFKFCKNMISPECFLEVLLLFVRNRVTLKGNTEFLKSNTT